ncbi:MAG: hypothetical protein EA376_03265 [Phycisphaeraceae bacterium]|nr:MAG: hypothetical protein EA376_03265 [Phycisphaeraceae bacterium]
MAAVSMFAGVAQAGFLMVPDSDATSGERLMLFDAFDGSLVDPNFIDLNPLDAFLPKHAMQVGNEIWLSDQVRNRIDRFNLAGSHLSAITEAAPGQPLSNIRGMGIVGNELYVTNEGTTDGAPGNALVGYDFSGNHVQNVPTAQTSPFDVLVYRNEVLVSHSSAADIQRYDLDLNHIGPFHVGAISFVQQMHERSNGNLLAIGSFGTSGIYEFDPSGAPTGFFVPVSNVPRGIWELGNGNLMYTNNQGVWVHDIATGGSTMIEAASAQYIDFLIPTPGAAAVFALAGLAAYRRRR